MTATLLASHEVAAVMRAAVRAPSVLNTQPWRWITSPDRLELHADEARALRVADPLGRMLVISCGASLFNAALALRHLGRHIEVDVVPDPLDPRWLAVIRILGREPVEPEEDWLYRAIAERRSDRRPYSERPIDNGTRRRLVEAAATEGARLVFADPPQTRSLLTIAADASRASAVDLARREEVANWLRPQVAADGLTRDTLGPLPADPRVPTAVREFDPAGLLGPRPAEPYEHQPTLAVLLTDHDDRASWVCAGQAIERVLLTATDAGLASSFLTEPLEQVDLRWRVRDTVGGSGYPQVVLRLGYGHPGASSPRRPLASVVERAPRPRTAPEEAP